MFFSKILSLSDFRIFLSILFHSVTVEGKNEFLKKSCLILKEGTFSTYLLKYDLLDTWIILGRYVGDCLLSYKNDKVFDTIVFFRDILALTLGKVFFGSSSYSLCYCKCWIILNFSKFCWNKLFTLCRIWYHHHQDGV